MDDVGVYRPMSTICSAALAVRLQTRVYLGYFEDLDPKLFYTFIHTYIPVHMYIGLHNFMYSLCAYINKHAYKYKYTYSCI